MAIVTVGIDLAKNVFALHALNAAGEPELVRQKVTRTARPAKQSARDPHA